MILERMPTGIREQNPAYSPLLLASTPRVKANFAEYPRGSVPFRALMDRNLQQWSSTGTPPCRRVEQLPEFPNVHAPEHSPILGVIPDERRGAFLALCHGVRPGEARALD